MLIRVKRSVKGRVDLKCKKKKVKRRVGYMVPLFWIIEFAMMLSKILFWRSLSVHQHLGNVFLLLRQLYALSTWHVLFSNEIFGSFCLPYTESLRNKRTLPWIIPWYHNIDKGLSKTLTIVLWFVFSNISEFNKNILPMLFLISNYYDTGKKTTIGVCHFINRDPYCFQRNMTQKEATS